MKRLYRLILIFLAILLVLTAAGCEGITSPPSRPASSASGSGQTTGIWVTGEGRISVTPDVAILNLGVEAQAATVGQAQEQASGAMNAILSQLKDNGMNDKDIQTSRFSIYSVRRWDPLKEQDVPDGYRVSNMVTAKIRQVERAGDIIDAVARAGGDLTRITGVTFTVDDPSDYLAEARKEAMEDAADRAEQLADVAGLRLGEPTYINESSGLVPYSTPKYAVAESMDAMGGTSVSPGETEIVITVQVAYSIR